MRAIIHRRVASFAFAVVVALSASSCGDDRVAAGTSGAEAENAVSARILLSDGSPAKGVRVVARPSGAATDSVWESAVTDTSGLAVFSLPASRGWVLEAVSDSVAAFVRVDSGVHQAVSVSLPLARTSVLSGRVVVGAAGTKVWIAGLGRSTTLGADGDFRFLDLPAGEVELRVQGLDSAWRPVLDPGDTTFVSLDALVAGGYAGDPRRPLLFLHQLPGGLYADALVPVEFVLPEGWPVQRLRLVTLAGEILPAQYASFDSASRSLRLWLRTKAVERSGSLRAVLDTVPVGSSAGSVFAVAGLSTTVLFSIPPGKSGTSDAWTNFATGRTLIGTSTVLYGMDPGDPLGGGIVSIDGSSMLVLGGTIIPESLSTVSIRLRSLDGWMESTRLLEIRDSNETMSVRYARTSDSLVVETSHSRQAFRLAADSGWHTYTMSRVGKNWWFWMDGDSVASLDADPAIAAKKLYVAEGGAARLAELFLGADALSSAKLVLLGGRARSRLYPSVR